jgi:hypothetical protein
MVFMLFVGGSKHAEYQDVNVDGGVPDKYGDAVDGGYYQTKAAEFVQNHPITGRPQWKYTVTAYVHSTIQASPNPEHNTYQLMADAVLRRWFTEHGERAPVSAMLRPVDDRVIQGNGAGVPPHEDAPPVMRDAWIITCVQCGRDEHVNERLAGDTLTTDPKVIATVYSGRDAAQVMRTHHGETSHTLTLTETQERVS